MAIDHRFIIKRLQSLTEMFVPYAKATHLPFVICDETSFDDQVHIFTDQNAAEDFILPYGERKIDLSITELTREHFLEFYGTLLNIGINVIVLHEANATTELGIEEIVHRTQNPDDLPPEKRPVLNPELCLTALYFLQEMRRPVPSEEKNGIAELDEELIANLVRARFLTGVEMDAKEPAADGKNNVRIPYILNNKGESYQLLFTDMQEMLKFDPEKKLRPIVLPFDKLTQFLIPDSGGYILNPKTISLPILRRQIPGFQKRMGLS